MPVGGATSDPIATDNGTAIIKVLEKQEVSLADLGKVKDKFREELLADRRNRFFSAYMAKAKQRMKIEVNRETVQRAREPTVFAYRITVIITKTLCPKSRRAALPQASFVSSRLVRKGSSQEGERHQRQRFPAVEHRQRTAQRSQRLQLPSGQVRRHPGAHRRLLARPDNWSTPARVALARRVDDELHVALRGIFARCLATMTARSSLRADRPARSASPAPGPDASLRDRVDLPAAWRETATFSTN
jgi:hypothetical protein